MKTRKILSLALALVLTLGLAAPAMAAGTPDIPMPNTHSSSIFTSEEIIRTDKDDLGNDILVYPEGTVFLHADATATDHWREKDNKDGAKGNTGYGSSFQLPKTGVVFEVDFGSFMESTVSKYIMIEGKEQPAEPAAPSEAPGEPDAAAAPGGEKYYIRGAEMMGTIDTELLGTSETKPESLSWLPFANLVPVGTVVSGEYGADYVVGAIYHGDTMEEFTSGEYLALMGTEAAEAPFTVATEDYYLVIPQDDLFFGGVLVKGVAAEGTAPADSAPAVAEEIDFTATPSVKTVDVDGKQIEIQFYSRKDYLGVVTDYVKIRDVASVLNGTPAQFNVAWDGAVNLIPGEAYVPNGSEMQTPFSGERTFSFPAADTKVAGQPADLDAIVLTDDQGGGFTYYQLWYLGNAVGFQAGIDAATGLWTIKTK